jgi:hypothetical protein
MAYCPRCSREMGGSETTCPHCGYDFPAEPDAVLRRSGIAYSAWADMALMIGGVVAGLSAVVAVFYSLAMLLQGNLLCGLVLGPVGFFFNLALLVVFLRIQRV